MAKLTAAIPLGGMAKPEEIAAVVVFLALPGNTRDQDLVRGEFNSGGVCIWLQFTIYELTPARALQDR